MKRYLALLGAVGALAAQVIAQQAPAPKPEEGGVTHERLVKANAEPQNWLTYSGTYMSQRYSLLNQITQDNVKDLELKWTYRSSRADKHEATPIVVDGVMYTIQNPNDVVALNAATGEKLWTYSHTPNPLARNCCGNLSRGVAVQGNRVFLAAFDAHMIAIDATTGKELWKTHAAEARDGYAFTTAPLVIKDKVIAGSAGGEFGVRGFIAAWEVSTGRELWRFNTIPLPGEPGGDTWAGDSWKYGGAPIWVTGSYDPDLDLMFWGTGNPGPDWDGRARLGDNLYSCSLIALDPDNGRLAWHYQFSPHNVFDWDSTQVPVLIDTEWQGRQRKLLSFANRSGVYYVLDRTNGEFLKGTSFVKTNWYTGFDAKGRPIMAPGMEPTVQGILVYPGNQGGTNWYNPSYSPRTGLFYIPAWVNSSSTYRVNEAPPEFHAAPPGQALGTFAGAGPRGGATNEDTFAAIRAIDAKTGEHKWDYRHANASMDAGVLTTVTDLLFSGARDGSFYALNARDGKELWKMMLVPASASVNPPGAAAPAPAAPGFGGNNFAAQAPAPQGRGAPQPGPGGAAPRGGQGGPPGGRGGRGGVQASVASGPMTYSVAGKQYVSITAGNVLFTFGLK
jgi:alcohol dehydrogenase (cytochrome c)